MSLIALAKNPQNTRKNNCGASCFASISIEIPKLPACSGRGMRPHPYITFPHKSGHSPSVSGPSRRWSRLLTSQAAGCKNEFVQICFRNNHWLCGTNISWIWQMEMTVGVFGFGSSEWAAGGTFSFQLGRSSTSSRWRCERRSSRYMVASGCLVAVSVSRDVPASVAHFGFPKDVVGLSWVHTHLVLLLSSAAAPILLLPPLLTLSENVAFKFCFHTMKVHQQQNMQV